MAMKYRVHLCEVIGDYAQDEWFEDYDTKAEALNRIEALKKEPHLGADWYIVTKDIIEEIEDNV